MAGNATGGNGNGNGGKASVGTGSAVGGGRCGPRAGKAMALRGPWAAQGAPGARGRGRQPECRRPQSLEQCIGFAWFGRRCRPVQPEFGAGALIQQGAHMQANPGSISTARAVGKLHRQRRSRERAGRWKQREHDGQLERRGWPASADGRASATAATEAAGRAMAAVAGATAGRGFGNRRRRRLRSGARQWFDRRHGGRWRSRRRRSVRQPECRHAEHVQQPLRRCGVGWRGRLDQSKRWCRGARAAGCQRAVGTSERPALRSEPSLPTNSRPRSAS